MTTAVQTADFSARRTSPPILGRLVRRPELAAFVVFILLYVFFTASAKNHNFITLDGTAAWMGSAAELAIIAIPVGLLLISGEFDLSIGSVIGASSILISLLSGTFDLELWISVPIALVFGACIGLANGVLVVRTGLPSFIVTLASSFILLGGSLGISRAIAGSSTLSMTMDGWVRDLLGARFLNFDIVVLWALIFALVGWWILSKSRFGPWIYATGGNREVARSAGVPVDKVKIALFTSVGFAAAFIGAIFTIQFNGGNVANGQGYTFQAPIVAVIGGILLSGGYGTVAGVVLGTGIYALISLGIFYTGWETDYIQLVLGALLLVAVIANSFLRRLALSR